MLNLLHSTTRQSVALALDGLQQRYMAIGSNVANAETPGYRAVDVRFEEALSAQLNSHRKNNPDNLPLIASTPGHISERGLLGLEGNVVDGFQAQTEYRRDGNGVDMDKEMAYLAQTGQKYTALAQLEGKMYKSLRGLITNNG